MPLALTGCLGLSGGSELIPPEASGPPPTEIQVGTSTTPVYSWLVGNISSLFVVRVATPLNPVWGVNSQGGNDIIPSPVRHGQTFKVVQNGQVVDNPNLSIISTAETVLTAGIEYRVTITTEGGFKQYSVNFFAPDGTTGLPTTVPTTAPASILSASTHSLALTRDGTAWAWGANRSGQIGDGAVTDSATPLAVSGLSDVVAVASGGSHSLAVTADGAVWSWGANGSGQLGDGSNADSAVPIRIPNLRGITAVAAGENHSLALDRAGKVWAWGENSNGQLGDGTTVNRNTPVAVEWLGQVVAIAAGKVHSMALTQDGAVLTWGGNYNGQLGDGTVANSSLPVQVGK